MPVRELKVALVESHQQLVDELSAEWRQTVPSNTEPLVLLERDNQKRIVHIYVIWSKWQGIDRVVRSEIIMESAQKVLGPSEAINVTIAMGLLPDEAKQFGIQG